MADTTDKKLELVFLLDNKSTMTLSLDNPQSGLTLSAAQAAAEKLIPILMSDSGAAAVSLKSAAVVESSRTSLT